MEIKELRKISKRLYYYYDINHNNEDGNVYFPKFIITKTVEEINTILKEKSNVGLIMIKSVLEKELQKSISNMIIIQKKVVETLLDCLNNIINEIVMNNLKNNNTSKHQGAIDKADTLSDMVLFHRRVRKNAEE